MPRGPTYSREEASEAIAASLTYAEALRRLGMCPTGGAAPILKKWASRWGISTAHFDPDKARLRGLGHAPKELEEILVEGSTYHRGHLKRRLFDAGLKERRCELCGQDENWNGHRISLILDHVNGVSTDNRLDNLQVVCPNCNAALETHCGRALRHPAEEVQCARCGETFLARNNRQRYCSRYCGQRWSRDPGTPNYALRRVVRPPYRQLTAEIDQLGYERVGRKYGVSGNAIRKWVRQYHFEQRSAEAA
jgi:ribosomal protein S27E